MSNVSIDSEASDSEGTDEDEIQSNNKTNTIDFYDPKEMKDLQVSSEVKEIFQNILR